MSIWSENEEEKLLQQNIWLSEDNEKIILCDIEYHDGQSLKLGTFSNSNYVMQYNDSFNWTFSDGTVSSISNVPYVDNIIGIPNIISRIDSDVNVGSIEFINAEGDYDNYINYAWEGHPLKIHIGDPSWDKNDFILILEAVSSNISSPRANIIALGIRDKKEVFNVKIQTNTIYWRSSTDNHLYNLYGLPTDPNYSPAFVKDLNNVSSYSTGIEVKINANATAEQIAKLTWDAIISNPAFEDATGTDPEGTPTGATTFLIQCALPGNVSAIEAAHDYTTGFTISVATPGTATEKEVISIACEDDVDRSLNSTYFGLYTLFNSYYVWYNVDYLGIDPRKIEDNSFTVGFDPYTQLAWIPPTVINTPIPLCYGKCFNIEPVLIDIYNHIYQVNDGPIAEIESIRANGVELSDEQYEVNLELGCFRLLVHDNNTQVTCTVYGINTREPTHNNNINIVPYSAAFIIEWIALSRSSLVAADICPVSFDSVNGLTNTSEMGVYINTETDIAPIITEIMSSIGGFARFARVCVLQLAQVIDPKSYTGDITLYIDEDNIVEKGISLSLTEPPKSSITLGFRRNWTTQDKSTLAGIFTSIVPESPDDLTQLYYVDLYSNEYSKVYANIPNIKDQYPLAEDTGIIPTLIYGKVDAQNEVDRRRTLRAVKRYVYKIESTAAPFTITVGDVINVTHRRFGFAYGKNALVIGLDEHPTDQRVTIEVWI